MKKGFPYITILLFTFTTLFAVACVRPTPRPENVQITEVPVLDPLPASPTPELVVTAVDTTEGEAPVEGATETSGEGEGEEPATISWPQSHEVVAGDTLSRIAIIYAVPAEEIIAANNLANPDDLEIGQILTILEPGTVDLTAVETPTPTETEEATSTTTEEQIYTVRAGDTLFRIATNYGTTVDELAEYNGIVNVNSLEVGQEIRIPPSE